MFLTCPYVDQATQNPTMSTLLRYYAIITPCRLVAGENRGYRLTQSPFWHTRRDPHPTSWVQVRGHGPTVFTGADVNSVREPTPQKISTGRPSQPQRPPGSIHELLPLGTMHLPLLSQPDVNPQR